MEKWKEKYAAWKRQAGVTDAMVAEWFGLSVHSFRRTSAKQRYIAALFRILEFAQHEKAPTE